MNIYCVIPHIGCFSKGKIKMPFIMSGHQNNQICNNAVFIILTANHTHILDRLSWSYLIYTRYVEVFEDMVDCSILPRPYNEIYIKKSGKKTKII